MFVALALGACSDRLYVPYPSLDPQGSAVLFVTVGGRIERAVAFDSEQPPSILADLASDRATLFLATYAESSSRLGLPAGALIADATGETLPKATLWQRAVVERSTVGPWEPDVPAPEVETFRTARATPCRTYRSEEITIPRPDVRVRYLLAYRAGGILVQLENEESWTIHARQGAQPVQVPYGRLSGDYTAYDGELWVTEEGGRLFHGDPELGFIEGPTRSSTLAAAMTGAGAGDQVELWALDTAGLVEHFQGGRWRRAVQLAEPTPVPDIVRVEPGVVYVRAGGSVLGRYDGDRLEGFDVGFLGYGIRKIEAAPGIGSGLAFIDDFDRLYAWRGPDFQPLPNILLPDGRIWVTSLGIGGLGLIGPAGYLSEWWKDYGYCDPIAIADQATAGLVRTTDDRLFTSRRFINTPGELPAITILTPNLR